MTWVNIDPVLTLPAPCRADNRQQAPHPVVEVRACPEPDYSTFRFFLVESVVEAILAQAKAGTGDTVPGAPQVEIRNSNAGPDHDSTYSRSRMMPASTGPHLGSGPFAFMNDNIVQAASEAIITIDEQQRVVMLNPAAQRMFGCAAVDVLGKSLSIFIPPRFHKAHARHVRAFDQSDTVERPMGVRSALTGIRANGQEFPIEASISRVEVAGSSGPRRFFTVLLRDISEVTRLRSEVETLNQRLKVILEMAPIAIWIIDGEQIVFANFACAALFGTPSHHDLMGRSIYSLLATDSQASVREVVARALAADNPVSTEGQRIARLDGSTRDVDIAVAALPDHGRTVVQMVLTDITSRTQESRELKISRRELRELSASMVDAREEERRRIAREMHDELGQRLTAMQMELSSLHALMPGRAAGARIDAMLAMVDETVASVRRISTDLRPLMLDDLGLTAAVEWFTQNWSRRMGIEVVSDLDEQDPSISAAAAIAVYRMIQEALTNVARHAHATVVEIKMHQDASDLELIVQDNGVGFSDLTAHRAGSLGLLGIRERATMLGGHLKVGNSRTGGARIVVRLPLQTTAAALPDDSDTATGQSPAVPVGRTARAGRRNRKAP